MAGSRLQHTCTPRPEQTPKAEQDREEGTRTRPAAPERSFTAAEEDAPPYESQVSTWGHPADWPRTGPMLLHRRRASARSARGRSGSGRDRRARTRSNPAFSWSAKGHTGNLKRGVPVLPVHRGKPQPPGREPRSHRPHAARHVGRSSSGNRGWEGGPGNRTTRTRHPRGPGGESCQGRGGRREEAIYLQLVSGAHIFTDEAAE